LDLAHFDSLRSPVQMGLLEDLQKSTDNLFPGLLGIRFLHVSGEEIRAEMDVTRAMCTLPGRMHGGALMAFADTLGAYGTALSLTDGAGTTTVESKTNFFSAGIEGSKVIGTATPQHRGRSTMVWQTRIEREDGRLVAVVTQTQIVLPRTKEPAEQMAGLFVGKEPPEQMALLAMLERSGGGLYRTWAEAEPDREKAAALMEAADREDRNADLLDRLANDR
jgi:1,4-dihydroxy-2-naphthoyl-CoA hydrolase